MAPSTGEAPDEELRRVAAALTRRGHYLAALDTLQKSPLKTDALKIELAELLVRVGRAEESERLAASVLRRNPGQSPLSARCHALRGIIQRDRGRLSDARESLLKAVRHADDACDREVAAWSNLRLILTVAEESGPHAARGIVTSARKRLHQLGDIQATAAFHLFLSELESKRGLFDAARRHLRTGRALLASEPNEWLTGYADIAEACVAYLESDIPGAASAAMRALDAGRNSGHRMTVVAAMATLAQVLLSKGDLAGAENQLREALTLCPRVGGVETAILDTLAQIRLATGDFTGCCETLADIARRAPTLDPGSFYHLCAALTEIRLALATGQRRHALDLATRAHKSAADRCFSTLTTSLRLLQAEALVHTGHHARAAVVVAEAAAGQEEPAPLETLAEVNRVAGVALAADGKLSDAGAAFERAARILATVGNRTGRDDLLEQYARAVWPAVRRGPVPFPDRPRRDHLPPPPVRVAVRLDALTRLVAAPGATSGSAAARAATILDAGGYPEVLAHELAGLLIDAGCTVAGALACRPAGGAAEVRAWWGCPWREALALAAAPPRRIDLGNWHGRRFEIAIRPAEGMEAALALAAAEKLARSARWQEQARREERERSALRPVEPGGDSGDAIFLSQGMLDLVGSVRRVAPLNVLVLLTGETGTGKEVIARIIHAASGRAAGPFVPFNCTAVPRELIDSQLFGYRRGAFTGAAADFPGVIRAAAGGTLFLDEIGELGLDVQPKLLRFLESGEIQPLGDPRPSRVDVRVVASTNANLERLVAEGRFREDLYYRLAVVRFPIPPLRERREEVPALAQHFLERAARDFQKEPLSLADESVEYLTLYRWPGNVRQLANEMRRLAALAEKGAVLMPEHLDAAITAGRRTVPAADRALADEELVVRLDQPLEAAVEHVERAAIQRAMAASGSRVEEAARRLGLSRKGLYLKRQRLGLE